MWINPKTDWTQNSYINYLDFDRIEKNTKEVATQLVNIQYYVPTLTYNTDRDNTHIDFLSSINRIENNIKILKDSFLTPPGYQESKVWTLGMGFSYADANRLENNLNLFYEWIPKVASSLRHCGAFSCGEDGDIY